MNSTTQTKKRTYKLGPRLTAHYSLKVLSELTGTTPRTCRRRFSDAGLSASNIQDLCILLQCCMINYQPVPGYKITPYEQKNMQIDEKQRELKMKRIERMLALSL